jgi:hypothetical protein
MISSASGYLLSSSTFGGGCLTLGLAPPEAAPIGLKKQLIQKRTNLAVVSVAVADPVTVGDEDVATVVSPLGIVTLWERLKAPATREYCCI